MGRSHASYVVRNQCQWLEVSFSVNKQTVIELRCLGVTRRCCMHHGNCSPTTRTTRVMGLRTTEHKEQTSNGLRMRAITQNRPEIGKSSSNMQANALSW